MRLKCDISKLKYEQAVMRGPTRVFLSQNGQFWTDSSFAEKNKNVTFLHYIRLAFMQNNQGNPMCGFQKNAENLRFWEFLTILAQILARRGPKCPIFEVS